MRAPSTTTEPRSGRVASARASGSSTPSDGGGAPGSKRTEVIRLLLDAWTVVVDQAPQSVAMVTAHEADEPRAGRQDHGHRGGGRPLRPPDGFRRDADLGGSERVGSP